MNRNSFLSECFGIIRRGKLKVKNGCFCFFFSEFCEVKVVIRILVLIKEVLRNFSWGFEVEFFICYN